MVVLQIWIAAFLLAHTVLDVTTLQNLQRDKRVVRNGGKKKKKKDGSQGLSDLYVYMYMFGPDQPFS